ncbi:unnamed protein product [Urochloa humidicola]
MATPTTISCPPPVSSTPAPMSSGGAPGAAAPLHQQAGRPPAAAAPTPPPPHPQKQPRLRYVGVKRLPGGGGWTAQVPVHPERPVYRTVGPFPDEHAAALAHDRLAIAYVGDRARANFRPAFNHMELRFLQLCREREREIDLCALVADPATYEAWYAAYLREVLGMPHWGEYLDPVIDFFMDRATEIGEEALVEGGEKLVARFVEMHGNKARDPRWRASYVSFLMKSVEMQRRQQQQRREGGCAGAGAVQPPPQQQQQVQVP